MSESVLPLPAAPTPVASNRVPVAVAVLLLLLVGLILTRFQGPRQALLLLIGAGLGLSLYHAAFGFTRAWREFISDRRGAGLRAQMLLFGLTIVVFFPVLAAGEWFGRPVYGFVVPAGMAVAVGAFIFGLGMQIGGGCASGTLFAVGGGNSRMLVTLIFFIVGSLLATHHLHWWYSLPKPPAISLVRSLGLWPALLSHLAIFAAIAAGSWVLEKRYHGRILPTAVSHGTFRQRWLRGPWPLPAGALALALLSMATLLVAGRPWGITAAFALWGGKAAYNLGWDITAWPYWSEAALARSILADSTSVMNLGIILGALLAAGLAGKFSPGWRIGGRQLVAAILGGLLLGYGARLASGCNIGAYYSGISSGSLHGWLWALTGFAGSVVGTRLRPRFGLAVERSPRGGC